MSNYDDTYIAYWLYGDTVQERLEPRVRRQLQRLYPRIQDVSDLYPNLDVGLGRTRLHSLHRKIDRLRGNNYFGSTPLQSQAQMLRRRQYVDAQDAMNLLILAEFARVYNDVWNIASSQYENVFHKKYKDFVGSDFTETLPSILMVTGETPLERLQIEAGYRARQMANHISGLKLDETWDGDIAIPVITSEMQTSNNRLLQKSTKGSWIGILDTHMSLYVAYAVKQAAIDMNVKRYKFHAIIDQSTTKVCRSLNGKIFNVEDMIIGVNAPPMPSHPCRSYISLLT